METNQEVQTFLVTVGQEAEAVRDVVIFNDDELKHQADCLRLIKTRLKELSDLRLSMTRPLDESKRSIMGLFAPYVEKLEGAEKAIKTAMVEYEHSVQEARRKEQEEANRIAAEREAAMRAELAAKAALAKQEDRPELAKTYERKAAEVNVTPINVSAAKRPGVSMRSVWRFKVVNPALLPREYLIPDEVKIGAVVRACKGDMQIPGVEIYEEKVMAGRAL